MSSSRNAPSGAAERPTAGLPSGRHDLDIERGSDVPISTQIFWQLAYQIESGRLIPRASRRLRQPEHDPPSTAASRRRLRGRPPRRGDAGRGPAAGPARLRRPGIVAETLRRAAQLGFTPDEVAQATFTAATERKRPGPLVRSCSPVRPPTRPSTWAVPRRAGRSRSCSSCRSSSVAPLRPGRDDDVPRGQGQATWLGRSVVAMLVSPSYISLVLVAGLSSGRPRVRLPAGR
jgi:hypothetical protein